MNCIQYRKEEIDMHFCRFNLEFVGLGYKMCQHTYWNYSLETFELYICKKCGKHIYKNIDIHNHIYKAHFEYCIENIKMCGYKTIGELLDGKEDKYGL